MKQKPSLFYKLSFKNNFNQEEKKNNMHSFSSKTYYMSKSSYPFYVVAYYIKWVTTSWTHSSVIFILFLGVWRSQMWGWLQVQQRWRDVLLPGYYAIFKVLWKTFTLSYRPYTIYIPHQRCLKQSTQIIQKMCHKKVCATYAPKWMQMLIRPILAYCVQ